MNLIIFEYGDIIPVGIQRKNFVNKQKPKAMKEMNNKSADKQRLSGAAPEGNTGLTSNQGDADKKHALVVSLFSMLQAPGASVVVPSFGDRNP